MLKILVCGSRDWADVDAIENRFDLVPYVLPDVPLVIQGGASGADSLAAKAARKRRWRVHTEEADWEQHGKAAGPIRNRQMLDMEPHVVFAFQRNGSKGTQDTINEARRRGIKVEVYTDSPALPSLRAGDSVSRSANSPQTRKDQD